MPRFLNLLILCLFALPLRAGDVGLYPDAIDPNAGFLRVAVQDEGFVNIAGKSRRNGVHGLSDFQILPAGLIEVAWSTGQTWVELPAGRHLSVLIAADGQVETREDPIANHPAKADVTLINSSDLSDLALFVPQAKADVFSALAPDQMATRALRAPLTLDFEFRAEGETMASLIGVQLLRKTGVTFVLSGTVGDYTAQAMPNRYER